MKRKIDILDIAIPFCLVYLSVLCFWSYFITGSPKGNVFDVITLTVISFIFMYGLISLIRDFKMFGWRWMLTSWRDIFK
jgi:hypothetical protein